MVLLKYVLSRLIAEKLLSLVALVEDITRIWRAREYTSLKNDLWASERLLRYWRQSCNDTRRGLSVKNQAPRFCNCASSCTGLISSFKMRLLAENKHLLIALVGSSDKKTFEVTVCAGLDPEGVQGLRPLFSNRRGSIISYNFITKEKISNAINNC